MTQQLAINLEALRKAHWAHWNPEENTLVLWCVAALQEQAAAPSKQVLEHIEPLAAQGAP